jgi:hypothetical protein
MTLRLKIDFQFIQVVNVLAIIGEPNQAGFKCLS